MTKRPIFSHACAAIALLAGSTLALAQVVTPPPGEAPRFEDHIPKAPPPAPMPPRPQMPQVESLNRKPAKPQVKLPDLPYEKLLKHDDKGQAIPLSEPPDLAALKRNPLVTPSDLEKIQTVLKDRRAAFERIVIDNLDLVENIEGGIFETIDLADGKGFNTLLNTSKPLREPSAPKPVHEELREKGLFTPEQAAFNEKISKEYLFDTVPPDPRRRLAMAYKHGVEEPLFVYRDLMVEAAKNLDKVLPTMTFDKDTLAKLSPATKAVRAAKDDAARLEAMKQLGDQLSLDQRKDLLRKSVELRSTN
jgi:hypothetical protein